MESLVDSIGKYPADRKFLGISEGPPHSMHSLFTQRLRQAVILCQVEKSLRYFAVQRLVTVAEEHIVIEHV